MRWVETHAACIGPQQPTPDVVVAWLTRLAILNVGELEEGDWMCEWASTFI
jgi:hypothetical protein